MASLSVQCHKPADTCEQKCNGNRGHSSGLGQKVAEMVSSVTGKHHATTEAQAHHYSHHATSKTETHCKSQSQSQSQSQIHHSSTGGHATLAKPNGKTMKKRSEHKKKNDKSLLQKIKDKVSGNSSSSDSSSSDSESDNEGCHKRKN